MEKKSLTVIIPAYNEAGRIEKAVEAVEKYFLDSGHLDNEIIIVDDGSSDNTEKVVLKLKEKYNNIFYFKNKENKGKGYSVKRGMLVATKEYVLFADADMSTPIEEFDKFEPYLKEGYEVVIGSRRIKGAVIKVYQPFFRRISGGLFHIVRRLMILGSIKDTQCGFKCFKKSVITEIFEKQKTDGFVFDVEVLYIASECGFKIKEVPIRWIDDLSSSLNSKHSRTIIGDFLSILKNAKMRLYKKK